MAEEEVKKRDIETIVDKDGNHPMENEAEIAAQEEPNELDAVDNDVLNTERSRVLDSTIRINIDTEMKPSKSSSTAQQTIALKIDVPQSLAQCNINLNIVSHHDE